MFIAPAAIFGGFFLWMYGGPMDTLTALDHLVVRGVQWAIEIGAALVAAVSKLWA